MGRLIAIKDFDMPHSCCDCCFRYYDETDGNWYCPVTKDFADIVNKGRHEDCPLMEVENGDVD